MQYSPINVPKNVHNCYDMASITLLAGISDYTDGIYNNCPEVSYEAAQRAQHEYLLDEIGATYPGFRLLDVGCGLGTLLETSRTRGVEGTGITISQDQVRLCMDKGLNVHLLNYKFLPVSMLHQFDGIIVNGALEHFCQPDDALRGDQDFIYRCMFAVFHDLMDPKSPHKKVATTAIHFRGDHVAPQRFIRGPIWHLFHKDGPHFSVLHRGYGGYYPVCGQLEKCAKPFFQIVKEVDGTRDYHLTSETWCMRLKSEMKNNPEFKKRLRHFFIRRPLHTLWATLSMVGLESWPWQFRGENPPVRLFRHTWKAI